MGRGVEKETWRQFAVEEESIHTQDQGKLLNFIHKLRRASADARNPAEA